MMVERRIYDLVERVSEEERTGSFGPHLLESLFSAFAQDLAILSAELWLQSRSEICRRQALGQEPPPLPADWMQSHFKRLKKSNPYWYLGPQGHAPAAVVTFGKRQKEFMVFHFHPEAFYAQRERIENTVLLITRLVTMFVQKHEERHQLHEILALSRHQQQRLISQGYHPFAGFDIFSQSIPAEEVGGDYHHLDLLSPDVLAVTIADAKGKGFTAAVQVTALHHCLRVLHQEPLKVTAKMSRLNQAFCHEEANKDLVSAVLGELHQDGRFLYVNASHPYPLLRRGRDLIELREGGLFLGLMPETKYRFGMVELWPGDVLFLCTDGVYESERGEQDQLAQMKEILVENGEGPLPELAASILALTNDREYRDDRTTVLIRMVNPQLNESIVGAVLVSPPPPPPPPPPAGTNQPAPQIASTKVITTGFVPPSVAPRNLPTVKDLPSVDVPPSNSIPGGVVGGVPGGVAGGSLGGVLGAPLAGVAAPPPPAPGSARTRTGRARKRHAPQSHRVEVELTEKLQGRNTVVIQ